MARHRQLAASPVRTAGATWTAITDLVVATLDRSPSIEGAAVRAALDSVAAAGRALIAGGHLDRLDLTVVAGPLYLVIGTVSGEVAFRALEDENPSPVPGAATADKWMVYVPRPAGLAALVDEVIQGVSNISAGEPPTEPANTEVKSAEIDLRRLDPTFRG